MPVFFKEQSPVHTVRNYESKETHTVPMPIHRRTKQRTYAGRPTHSQYRGVTWCKQKRMWKACIREHGRTRHIGLFDIETDAAEAYREAIAKQVTQLTPVEIIP